MNNQILEFIENLHKNDCCPVIVNEKLASAESWGSLDVFESVTYPFGYLKVGYSYSHNCLIVEFTSNDEVETKVIPIKDRNPKTGFCSLLGLNIFHYVNRALEEVMLAKPNEFYSQKERLFDWETKVSEKIHRVKLDRLFAYSCC